MELPDGWEAWPAEAKARLLEQLRAQAGRFKPRPWHAKARPNQLPPPGDWNVLLVCAGRGWGKTAMGANWLAEQAIAHPGTQWAVLAPTFRDTRTTCIEGSSGILAALGEGELVSYRRNELAVTVLGGSTIFGYSADQPDRIRGSNLYGSWCDEISSWRYPEAWYEGLIPALRKGKHPRVLATTTPRPTALMKDLMGRRDGSVVVIRGSTWDNAANLSETALAELRARYAGTRLGRQELEGELLEDLEGALWSSGLIDETRIKAEAVPDLMRIVVGVDPSGSSRGAETGIIVAALDHSGHFYILDDFSLRGSPEEWARKAITAYYRHKADRIVAEKNFGGEMVAATIRNLDAGVPVRTVVASRGKLARAEPIAALYEQHRVHHVGAFAELEDQMVGFVPGMPGPSPDRADACVWALAELNVGAPALHYLTAITTQCPRCAYPNLRRLEVCKGCGHRLPAPAPRAATASPS